MRVVCGTDLLPKSDSALERAGMLAERLGATLSLIHAVPDAESDYLVEQEMERAGRHLKRRATPPRWRHGPTPTVEVRAGSPARVLIEAARELDPALVVLGANRRRFARDTVAGTTAERILKRVDCPVLIVRRMPWRAYRSVLLVLDCAGPEEVVHAAGKLMLHEGAGAAVSHSHDPFCSAPSHGDIEQLPPMHRDVKRLKPDLLVVGAGRRGWLRRTLLGDVVNRVLAMRGSDVLIVPRRRACAAPRRNRPERHGSPLWPFWQRRPGAAT